MTASQESMVTKPANALELGGLWTENGQREYFCIVIGCNTNLIRRHKIVHQKFKIVHLITMIGPFPKGTYTKDSAPNRGKKWEHLESGRPYKVVREFLDNDKQLHPVGETWTFLGHSFNQWDDGHSFFITLDGEQEWHIPMQNTAEEQAAVLDRFVDYVVVQEVQGPDAPK